MKAVEYQLKALANGRRLAIVKFLKKSHKASVGDIAREIRLSFKSTSRHLSILLAAEIVTKEQVNLNMLYSLQTPAALPARYIISYL